MKPGTARVPVDEVVSENPDKMSMAVIKFGTTTNLQTEDKYYAGDDGFFLCSFPLLESGEAETVNDIVCVDSADAAQRATRKARRLPEFSPNREPLRVEVRRREIDDAMVARNRKQQLRTMQDEKLTGEVSMLCRWSALNAAP